MSELFEQMRAQGLVPPDAPAPLDEGADRTWFVSLLQGVAGWLAGIFLLVFLGLVFRPESSTALFLLGALLLGCAWFLYYKDRSAVFLDQLALAISIAGQFAIAASVVKDDLSALSIATTALAVQIFVLIIMPNKVARTLAALFASIAWVFTVRFLLAPGDGGEVLFGDNHEMTRSPLGALSPVVGWALTWIPLLAMTGW